MTIKEFINLKGNEILEFTGAACDEPVGQLYRIKSMTKIYRDEPKFTVRQFLTMTEKEIDELKMWEPEVGGGYIKLCNYNTTDEVCPLIKQKTMYSSRYGYSYRCLKIVKE